MSNMLNLKVIAVESETADAVTIHLKPPFLRRLDYRAGQYLSLEFDAAGVPQRRAYSLSSTPGLDRHLSITVKKVDGGLVSARLVEQLSAGDRVRSLGTSGRFVLAPGARHLAMLAGGSGITPIFSIIKQALHFELDSQVTLIYCNRNRQSAIFADKLDQLAARYPGRLQVIHLFSRPEDGSAGARLCQERALELLGPLNGEHTHYYLCGPAGMMQQARDALQRLQVSDSRVHLENFVAPLKQGAPGVTPAGLASQVHLHLQGREFSFAVKPGQTILEAALAQGVEPPFSCRSGFCTACVCTRIAGEVEMAEGHGLSAAELKMGQALMCVGYPKTAEVRLAVD